MAKNVRGGSQIIDFGNVNFITDGSHSYTMPSLLESIKHCNRKVLRSNHLILNGERIDDIFFQVSITDNDDGYNGFFSVSTGGGDDRFEFTIEDPTGECSIVKSTTVVLPAYTEDDIGKILAITAEGLAWIEPRPLPESTVDDAGKVLTVGNDGDPEWATAE